MAETFSQTCNGINAGSPFTAQVIDVGDSQSLAGSQAYQALLGTQVLCKNPDGSKSWYTIDTTRSTNPLAPVLLKAYG